MKVFRRICILLVVVALIAAMPLSAFAASASRTVPYNGYDYVCYAQCGPSTAYASTETECPTSQVKVTAYVYNGAVMVQTLSSNYKSGTADVYFSSLTAHTKLGTEHHVSSEDGVVRLTTHTVVC